MARWHISSEVTVRVIRSVKKCCIFSALDKADDDT